jgi:D-aminopeptidase
MSSPGRAGAATRRSSTLRLMLRHRGARQQAGGRQMRLRELGLNVGFGTPGPENAITDVPGVMVGHATLISGGGPLIPGSGPVRTGVTVIRPVPGYVRESPLCAGVHTLNGNGELTGTAWICESGLLTTPIALTNTHSVGVVRDALAALDSADGRARTGGRAVYRSMPVVGETYDGVLNDIEGAHVRPDHVTAAYGAASSGQVDEGSVGGGTGMICHEFKGGIGTASRVLPAPDGGWHVGILVQANHGGRADLRVDGVPVGRFLPSSVVPVPGDYAPGGRLDPGTGSIIVVIATDAPVLGDQCRRLAQRAAIGIGRAGGGTSDSSGDIFLAFSTARQPVPAEYFLSGAQRPAAIELRALPHDRLSPLFAAVAEATEEAIINALLAASDMTGRDGITAHGLTPELLARGFALAADDLASTASRLSQTAGDTPLQ